MTNTTNGAVAGVFKTPATVPTVDIQPASSQSQLTRMELGTMLDLERSRFMPVMDITQALERRDLIIQATSKLMNRDVDFGKIPGCDRDVLLQPGADKLCNLFGIVIEYEVTRRVEDWSGAEHGGEPLFFYEVKGKAFRGQFLMGEGVGSCSSREGKYRWRKGERTCPVCNHETIRKSRDGGGWYCWGKIGGCGEQFPAGATSIESQQVGRKPNPDVADQVNTILKMAYKRAKVATAINATSASEFFTQDAEDFTPPEELPIDTGGAPMGTAAAAAYVAQEKIRKANGSCAPPWKTMRDMAQMFQAAREDAGETEFYAEFQRYGWNDFQDLRRALDRREPGASQKAIEIYVHLQAISRKEVA